MPVSLLSASNVASAVAVGKDTGYAWTFGRAMPVHGVERRWKFPSTEVDDWVRRGGAAADDMGEG